MPPDYTYEEHQIAFKILKAITSLTCDNKEISMKDKEAYINGFNIKNLVKMLSQCVDGIIKYNIENSVKCRDMSLLNAKDLFYNYEIFHNDCNYGETIKLVNYEILFNTGDIKVGYQKGFVNEKGTVTFSKYEYSEINDEKCYVGISKGLVKDAFSNEILKEIIFIDYYFGNNYLE